MSPRAALYARAALRLALALALPPALTAGLAAAFTGRSVGDVLALIGWPMPALALFALGCALALAGFVAGVLTLDDFGRNRRT